MSKQVKLKLKIEIPKGSNVFTEIGSKLLNELIYEVDQLEVLEEVKLENKDIHFNVKDGQFVSAGDTIFTEGFAGHKAMITDFNGIVEITDTVCRVLGQKRHIERRINYNGEVIRVVPNKEIVLSCDVLKIKPATYINTKKILSKKVYLSSKKEITQDNIIFPSTDITYFINDNLYLDDLAKLIAFGAKRIIINSIFVDDLKNFYREIKKLDSFAIMSGFGELTGRRIVLKDGDKDIYWGKKNLYFADKIEHAPARIFEHPFWGIAGTVKPKNEIVGNLDYNNEVIEVYLKNVEHKE